MTATTCLPVRPPAAHRGTQLRWVTLRAAALIVATAASLAQDQPLGSEDYATIASRFRAAKAFEAAAAFAEAAEEYRSILQRYPTAVPRVHHNLGTVLYQQRAYAEAIEAFEAGLALDGTMAASRLLVGMAHLNLERSDLALPHLEAAHRAQPTFESAISLGQAYMGNIRYAEAVGAFREALPLAEDRTPDVLYSLGQSYLKLAERIVNEQAEEFPESGHTHLAAAKLFESQQVYQVAAIKYLEAAEADPMNASIFFPLARMLAVLGLEVPSNLALGRYWSLVPSVPRVPIDKDLLPKEQVAEIGTKVDFEGILRSLPLVDPERLPPLAMVPGAINEELRLRLDGADALAWSAVAETASSGRFRETLEVLEAIRAPEDQWLREYLRASVHIWLDDYARAARVAVGATLAERTSEPVRTLRAEIFRLTSIEHFDRLVREHPSSCRARLVQAMNFAAQEKAEAEAEFLAAIEACPRDTQIRIELADYYLSHSQYAEARQACLDELRVAPPFQRGAQAAGADPRAAARGRAGPAAPAGRGRVRYPGCRCA